MMSEKVATRTLRTSNTVTEEALPQAGMSISLLVDESTNVFSGCRNGCSRERQDENRKLHTGNETFFHPQGTIVRTVATSI